MPLVKFKTHPIMGLKVDVPANDISMMKLMSNDTAITYDAGGQNMSLQRKRQACTTAYGRLQWDTAAIKSATKCLGLFNLIGSTNKDTIFADNGKIYVYDGALAPVDRTPTGVTFANDDMDLYSFLQYGDYVIMADMGHTTPYKWTNGDAKFTKLIDPSGISGYTSFKFRYMEIFQRRIIGAYSDQTNGDIELRWTTSLPDITTDMEFPASNQAYKADDKSITGIKKMGQNSCFLYSDSSIDRMEYYPSATMPFSIVNIIPFQGSVNHHSIVSTGDAHYFFNRNYGFCKFDGTQQFPSGGAPISADIEPWMAEIDTDYFGAIVGVYIPQLRQIVWTVPMGGSANPNYLFFYDLRDGQWTREEKPARYVDNWQIYTDYDWTDLETEAGGASAIWTPIATTSWAYYFSRLNALVHANTDGHLYKREGLLFDLARTGNYRIEPAMDFGDPHRVDLLLEIWFDFSVYATGASLLVYHRSGDTIGELESAAWTVISQASGGTPYLSTSTAAAGENRPMCLRLSKAGRIHQIKWGHDTSYDSTPGVTGTEIRSLGVRQITYVFAPGGQY